MPLETHSAPLAGAPRRKNGRQQACEPCRRRKVACDHRLPVCSRCRRGDVADKCVYLTHDNNGHQSRRGTIAASQEASSSRQLGAGPNSATPGSEIGIGYLGATSITAFYEEAQNSLKVIEKRESTPERGFRVNKADSWPGTHELALGILRCIPDKPSSQLLVKFYSSFNDGWCPLSGEILNESLWTTFGSILEGERDDASLTQIAVTLSENSSVPLKESYPSAKSWLESFSGPNFRWESIAHLFIYWAYGSRRPLNKILLSKECQMLHNSKRETLVSQFKLCVWKCIELTRNTSNANPLLGFLVFKHSLLESMVSGDAGMHYWRAHGDLMSLTTYLGLHVSPHADPMDYSISAQMKRRLFAIIFVHDKVTATFSGRPPFLSRRFSSTPMPLDLSDEFLLADPPAATLRDVPVDENGWNTNGEVYPVTILRARVMLAHVREFILENSLQGVEFTSKTALLELKKQEMNAIANCPSFIIYRSSDIRDLNICGQVVYLKLLLWLEHLQNLFFIERLLSKHLGEKPTQRLFDISIEMMSLSFLFWTHQNRLATAGDCIEWIMVSFAAPAGGLLCMELLKNKYSVDPMPTSRKAVIIEQLGMFTSFLEWVGPSTPNMDITHSVKKVVRRVIEQALEPPVQPGMEEPAEHWDMELSADVNAFFNFELLDTFDWMRPDGGSA